MIKTIVFGLSTLVLTCYASAQSVYNEFGQNTCQEKTETYSLKQDQIEILYQLHGDHIAKTTLDEVQSVIPEFENRLNYNLSNGIKILVFNHYNAYRQSPFHITNPQYFAGGYSTLNENVAAIYFDGNTQLFKLQIRKAVAQVMINEFIFGGNIRERIQTATLLTLPDWYYKGLMAYLAESWNIDNDNHLKDFFQSKKERQFTSLQASDAILAGHSIWRYLEEKNGRGAVSNIVFLTKLGRNVENAFMYYTGMNINQLLNDWQSFYQDKYKQDELAFKLPKGQENAPTSLSKKRFTQFKLSNDGQSIAIVTNQLGRYQIILYNIAKQSVKIIARGGQQLLNRNIELQYPLIQFHPQKQCLSVMYFEHDEATLYNYDLTGQLIEQKPLKGIPFVKGFSYDHSGERIALSVIQNGQSDLMLYHLKTNQIEQLSNDASDQLNPRFSADDQSILFNSNQYRLSPHNSAYLAIFQYHISTKRIDYLIGHQDNYANAIEPNEIKPGVISYLSDQNGIMNNYAFDVKSNQSYMLTNYKRCIISNDVSESGSQVADLVFYNNRYRIYIGEMSLQWQSDVVKDAPITAYRKWCIRELDSSFFKDSVQIGLSQLPQDTIFKSLERLFICGFPNKESSLLNNKSKPVVSEPLFGQAKPQFGVDYFLQQLDKSIIGSPLFPSNVTEKVFNYPLISPHLQTSISDIQKNNTLVAGIRIPLRIKASDYYLHYSNRSGRWDKDLYGFRRSRVFEVYSEAQKMVNAQIKGSIAYPFNERSRIGFNAFVRNDRLGFMAGDSIQLQNKIQNNVFIGQGIEYVFDNIKSNGLNLFEGLRIKYQADFYNQTQNQKSMLNQLLDARWYHQIHRQLYFASRLSGAWSIGQQQTAYYLGGVENALINVDSNNFNYNLPLLNKAPYAFQTIVTPARGFIRNTRAGNKYLLLNMELRWPIFAYLNQKPIASEFFRSVMLVGFADIGTAWQGSSPYSLSNPFNTKIVQAPLYTLTVSTQRDPFLYALGFGLRAKILGHYIKFDQGWGYSERALLKPQTTVSIGLDF